MTAPKSETFVPPSSSHIASATHDQDAETLDVEFADGSSYRYFGVPYNVYVSLTRAGSAGGFFYRQIKGRYAYEQT